MGNTLDFARQLAPSVAGRARVLDGAAVENLYNRVWEDRIAEPSEQADLREILSPASGKPIEDTFSVDPARRSWLQASADTTLQQQVQGLKTEITAAENELKTLHYSTDRAQNSYVTRRRAALEALIDSRHASIEKLQGFINAPAIAAEQEAARAQAELVAAAAARAAALQAAIVQATTPGPANAVAAAPLQSPPSEAHPSVNGGLTTRPVDSHGIPFQQGTGSSWFNPTRR